MSFIRMAVTAAAAFSASIAMAAGYPERTVTIVVPYAPGGATDAGARLVAQALQKQSGISFIVENVPGAGTTVGAAKVARAAADGYTLLWGGLSSNVMAPQIYAKLPFDAASAFEPVSMIATQPYMLVTQANSPFRNVADLVARARAEPGKLNFGSPGEGSSPHLTTELFLAESRITALHIPYKGAAPSLAALIAGDTSFMFDTLTAPMPMIAAGRLKALAVTSSRRLPELPDVPTLQESGLAGFDAYTWFALFAPRGTPADVVNTLNRMVTEQLRDPALRAQMAKSYFTTAASTPAALGNTVKAETAKWAAIIKAKNIRRE